MDLSDEVLVSFDCDESVANVDSEEERVGPNEELVWEDAGGPPCEGIPGRLEDCPDAPPACRDGPACKDWPALDEVHSEVGGGSRRNSPVARPAISDHSRTSKLGKPSTSSSSSCDTGCDVDSVACGDSGPECSEIPLCLEAIASASLASTSLLQLSLNYTKISINH